LVGLSRQISSDIQIGCGCCHMMNGETLLGLSTPSGPTILGHQAPFRPWLAARAWASFRWPTYQGRLRSRYSGLFHRAKWPACQGCISRWNLPFQLLENSPSSCGGTSPAAFRAIRYCDSTTRRSSSAARGSVLPLKSTAAPSVQ
jgi:hypothetical protein